MSNQYSGAGAHAGVQTDAIDGTAALSEMSPGAWLAAARQAQGLTVEQVASQLNLAPRQVVALEADDHAALPGMVIARGFLRAYAKLLKVDPVPLLALLAEHAPPVRAVPVRHALSASFSETRMPFRAASGTRSKVVPLVAGVGLVLIAAAATFALGWWPEAIVRRVAQLKTRTEGGGAASASAAAVSVAPAGDAAHAEVPAPASSLISTKILANPVADAAPPASGAVAPVPVAPPAMASPAKDGKPAGSGAVPAVAVASSAPAAAAGSPLVLTIQKDSWIEIKRADKTAIVAKVFKAGSTETFDITEPVTLIVGNIGGVEASLRGAPVELASGANGNVARVRLK